MSAAAAIALVFPALLSGCDQLHHATPGQNPTPSPHSNYVLTSTVADGTFLLETQTGKVWRYSAKDDAFLEVVVTSKILHYERGPDGKMHIENPKNDPLEIR